jgi:tRNA U34 5-methylaminomethyl-2-thiouridine-forming methyltransferase MnmC
LEVIWQENSACVVELIGLELNPEVPKAAIRQNIFNDWDDQYRKISPELAFKHYLQTNRLQAKLLIGDAKKSIQEVRKSAFQADAIFLDPFSPQQCPQLSIIEFIQQLAFCLHPDGLLATYSCAAAVRTALLSAGLIIGSTTPVGRRTPGTIAAYPQDGEKNITEIYPISLAETEHLQTHAAVPYRDPRLSDSTEYIINRRQQEQQASSLEPTSPWRKRWD